MYKNKTQRRSRKSSLTWCNRGIWEVQRRKGMEHKNIYKNTQGRNMHNIFFSHWTREAVLPTFHSQRKTKQKIYTPSPILSLISRSLAPSLVFSRYLPSHTNKTLFRYSGTQSPFRFFFPIFSASLSLPLSLSTVLTPCGVVFVKRIVLVENRLRRLLKRLRFGVITNDWG